MKNKRISIAYQDGGKMKGYTSKDKLPRKKGLRQPINLRTEVNNAVESIDAAISEKRANKLRSSGDPVKAAKVVEKNYLNRKEYRDIQRKRGKTKYAGGGKMKKYDDGGDLFGEAYDAWMNKESKDQQGFQDWAIDKGYGSRFSDYVSSSKNYGRDTSGSWTAQGNRPDAPDWGQGGFSQLEDYYASQQRQTSQPVSSITPPTRNTALPSPTRTPISDVPEVVKPSRPKKDWNFRGAGDMLYAGTQFLDNIQEAKNLSRLAKDKYPKMEVAAPGLEDKVDMSRPIYEARANMRSARKSINQSGLSAAQRAATAGNLYAQSEGVASRYRVQEANMNRSIDARNKQRTQAAAQAMAGAEFAHQKAEFEKRDDIGIRQVANLQNLGDDMTAMYQYGIDRRTNQDQAWIDAAASDPRSLEYLRRQDPQRFYRITGMNPQRAKYGGKMRKRIG
jgi:hypothetical protein